MYDARILADSIASGTRLTTVQVTFPRIVLAEFNTHRVFSRNSASSRAIPVEKRLHEVRQNPFIPEAFASNKKGMQAGDTLGDADQEQARMAWLDAAYQAASYASALSKIGVHKQWANRLIEPFSWHTVICSATEWENFFGLRCNPEAQPEIRRAAELIRDVMAASIPVEKKPGEWHLPLVFDEDLEAFSDHDPAALPMEDLPKVSVARCARVSYLTHDGKRDLNADITLYHRLLGSGHMSPFEHAAVAGVPQPFEFGYETRVPGDKNERLWRGSFIGNFRSPWVQHRKMLAGEAVFRGNPR